MQQRGELWLQAHEEFFPIPATRSALPSHSYNFQYPPVLVVRHSHKANKPSPSPLRLPHGNCARLKLTLRKVKICIRIISLTCADLKRAGRRLAILACEGLYRAGGNYTGRERRERTGFCPFSRSNEFRMVFAESRRWSSEEDRATRRN